MAATQHTRTRSARLMANLTNSKLASQQQPGTASAANHHHAAATSYPGASPLALFLTNLRLLDLDLRPDWPGISAETFAATGSSAQGQKKRVQCVEWALYQLFALWDPEEARNKLKPFFPPLDQVQSLNLRAALLRCLEQAKKNGVLGREAIVRKTMLDECRGERLEEVLAAFSSAVLKSVVADQIAQGGEHHPALAVQLALEDRGYKDDKTELNALVLAHKVSLHRALRGKAAVNERFRDFADLLNVKERGIARRKEAVLAKENDEGSKTVSGDAKLEMWRTIRNNWSGNEGWMATLLYGDTNAGKDGFFEVPLDRVWRRVQQGRLGELESHGGGLLEQLDSRVRIHRERLEKWEGFRRSMCQDRPRASPSKKTKQEAAKKGMDLGFGAHEGLQVGRSSPRKPTISNRTAPLNHEYASLVSSLENELSRTAPQVPSVLSILQRPRDEGLINPTPRRQSTSLEEEPEFEPETRSEVSELDEGDLEADAYLPQAPVQSFQTKLENSRRLPVRPKISHSEDSYTSNRSALRTSASSRDLRSQMGQDLPNYCTTSSELGQSPEASRNNSAEDVTLQPKLSHSPEYIEPAQPASPVMEDVPPSPIMEDIPPSPTQQLADQILASMNQASPSPTKRTKPRHTLSLAERTRLSMARTPLDFPDHDEPDLPLNPTAANASAAPSSIPEDTTDAFEDLASRTRRSMAGFEKARQKAQIERRRSLRRSKVPPKREGSYFPKVEEDEHEQSVLAEELMGGEEDMEAVFRSRPKIKASPIPSPTKEWDGEDYL